MDVADQDEYEERGRSLKHSKSAPRINNINRNLEFKLTDPNSRDEPRRMTHNGVASPRSSQGDPKNLTGRPTSEERYSVGKKNLVQSIQDFSKGIMQSTKDLVNRFWTGARTKC